MNKLQAGETRLINRADIDHVIYMRLILYNILYKFHNESLDKFLTFAQL